MKASDNVFPKVIISEGAAPATPATGTVVIYAKTDGLMYAMDDAGTETAMGSSGSAATPENVQTGTSYTLVLADAFKMVCMDNAVANTLTVPPNSSVAFPVGTRIDVSQDGAGQTTIASGTGVTIRTPETLKLRKQWAKATLIKRATDTWDLEGNLEAAP